MENLIDCKWFRVPVMNEDGDLIGERSLGIIAKKSDGDESWKAYMGVCSPESGNDPMNKERKDIEAIIEHGAQLPRVEAQMWFPLIELPYRA